MDIFAMGPKDTARFLADSRLVKETARTMKADAMRTAVEQIYAEAKVNRTGSKESQPPYVLAEDGTAHISVTGMLVPKASVCAAFSMRSETEYGFISAATRLALEDSAVQRICYDIDSPGGYVSGVDECAQVIANATKPTAAVVHNLCASAAYWLASQCDTITAASPAAEIGSIGVASEEYDDDEANRAAGIEHRIYTSSHAPEKRPDTKTEEGRAVIQKQLDATEAVFVSRVAQGRGTTTKDVYENYGKGGVYTAGTALRHGMIDAVTDRRKNRHNSPEKGAVNRGGQAMILDEFKAENPEALEAYAKEQFDAGVKAERDRREALAQFRGINKEGDAAVTEAVQSGKSFAEAAPAIQAAILKGKVGEAAAGENAPAVKTGANDTAESYGENVSAEDAAWYRKEGLTPADVRNFARK